MARLNPARRAALKAFRKAAYERRLEVERLNMANTAGPMVHVDIGTYGPTFSPVGGYSPNSKGWEYGSTPKGSFRAVAPDDANFKLGIVFDDPRNRVKRYKSHSRA